MHALNYPSCMYHVTYSIQRIVALYQNVSLETFCKFVTLAKLSIALAACVIRTSHTLYITLYIYNYTIFAMDSS